MHLKSALTATLIATLLSACASTNSPNAAAGDSVLNSDETATQVASSELIIEEEQAQLVASLPNEIESFELSGARAFDVEGDGVNVRYANDRKRRRADVFVYPVAENNKKLTHPDLVLGSTQATVQAITEAVQAGVYQNLNVIDAATKANGLRTIARVQATYLRENLASYTLVYQTEHDGTMVKIRLTMPDNESNRSSREWDRFADEVFQSVTEYLDLENQALPESPDTTSTADTATI